MSESPRIHSSTVRELLEALAAPAPAPAGGSAAALSAAMGAALVDLVARASSEWAEAPGIAAQARVLHERLLELADADADAFATALAELRLARSAGADRDVRIGQALGLAADAPLAIAEAAADVHALARLAIADGRADVRPDAQVALELARAAARGAAHLVEINLATLPGDVRSLRAAAAAEAVGDG